MKKIKLFSKLKQSSFFFQKKALIKLIAIMIGLIIVLNFTSIRENARKNLPPGFKNYVKKIFFGEQYLKEIKTYRIQNYNAKTLPETEFLRIKFEKVLVKGLEETDKLNYNKLQKAGLLVKKFFIENNNGDLIAISSLGKIVNYKNFNLNNGYKIDSNLEDFKLFSVLDSKVIDDLIFLTISSDYDLKKECSYFKIIKSKLNKKKLHFENFFTSNNCIGNVQGGRIVDYNFRGKKGLLVTTGAIEKESKFAQDNDSQLGKTLFFKMNGESEIYSKGHRNPQGLTVVEDNIILQTEHGPYGGDEINKIIYKKNYGYPISSYGEPYEYKKKIKKNISNSNLKYSYKKNHKELAYEEPIFSFVPSIGISQIVKVPNKFSPLWKDNFLVSSLNGRSLYRIKFDNEYSKILFIEKIYIGERIRDVFIGPNERKIYLALETTGSIGFIQSQ
tara:strand:+ start:929 stop:2263 length:1335 start_codon:yes stop_codon:yes gene_type:complete